MMNKYDVPKILDRKIRNKFLLEQIDGKVTTKDKAIEFIKELLGLQSINAQ